jgi:UDP-N-acetylmuramoyl-tripeptide--D-alanyl-D-alanine ligase
MKTLWTFKDALEALHNRGVKSTHNAAWEATGVAIDSRTVKPGDLFIALQGPNQDGHLYIEKALAAGAVAVLGHKKPNDYSGQKPLLMVDDTFKALQDLGTFSRQRAQGKIIAVTGSVGKTGSKEQLRLILSMHAETYANEGSFNNHWGVPLSLARLPDDARYGVFELGMNHAGELAPLSRQVRPHVALITNVEAVHLEFFKSVEDIADAKAEIFAGLGNHGIAILNRDSPHHDRLAGHARHQSVGTILSFGRHAEADAKLLDYAALENGSRVTASIAGKTITYEIGMPGQHIALNSLGTLLAAHAAGADAATSAHALKHYKAPAGRGTRMQIAVPDGTFTLIDESYNASPVATRATIAVLGQTSPAPGGRRIMVLGDMRELGASGKALHASLAPDLEAASVDKVFCAGELSETLYNALPAPMRGHYAADSKALAPLVAAYVGAGDLVVVKGSKSMHMELVVDAVKALAVPAANVKRQAHS